MCAHSMQSLCVHTGMRDTAVCAQKIHQACMCYDKRSRCKVVVQLTCPDSCMKESGCARLAQQLVHRTTKTNGDIIIIIGTAESAHKQNQTPLIGLLPCCYCYSEPATACASLAHMLNSIQEWSTNNSAAYDVLIRTLTSIVLLKGHACRCRDSKPLPLFHPCYALINVKPNQ